VKEDEDKLEVRLRGPVVLIGGCKSYTTATWYIRDLQVEERSCVESEKVAIQVEISIYRFRRMDESTN